MRNPQQLSAADDIRDAVDEYTFAYALIELRDTYHLSQQDFAKRIGISPQFQCDLESGRRMPSVRIKRGQYRAGRAVGWLAMAHARGCRFLRYGDAAGRGKRQMAARSALVRRRNQ